MPPETPRVRQKPVSLPTPTKELDGSIRTTSVYRWLRQVAKAVDDLGLDRSYTLYQLANEAKLPSSWREVFRSARESILLIPASRNWWGGSLGSLRQMG